MIKFTDTLSYEIVIGALKPVGAFGICATVLSSFFLFYPQSVFKGFLKAIASWYFPILFILTATTPISSGHVMSVDRSVVVLWGMVFLGLIAVVYALVVRKRI